MDALEYEKARVRMCRTMILEKGGCEACPLYNVLKRKCGFSASIIPNPDIDTIKNNVDRVIKWAKDHPVKTRQSELLRIFPDARIDDAGILAFCPSAFMPKEIGDEYCNKYNKCEECRKDYWLTDVPDND